MTAAGPRTSFYEVRGLRLAVHEWGTSGRPVLLCLHGFLDHGRSFAPIAEALAADYHVLAPDLRGHGASDWVGAGGYYHFHDYYGDLMELVESRGLAEFSVLAHSMGGSIAIVLANLYADRVQKMVLLEGVGPEGEDLRRAPDRLQRHLQALRRPALIGDVAYRRAHRRVFESVDEAAERLMELNRHLSLPRALDLARDGTRAAVQPDGRPGVAWAFDPLHRTPSARPFNFEEFRTFMLGVSAPVLALYGGDSTFPMGALEERHRLFRSLRAAVVAQTGHNLHHDKPEAVLAATRFWLGTNGGGPLPAGLSELEPGAPAAGGPS